MHNYFQIVYNFYHRPMWIIQIATLKILQGLHVLSGLSRWKLSTILFKYFQRSSQCDFFQAVGDNSIENITIYCSKPPFFVIIGKLILKNMQQCSQSQTSSYVMFAKSVHIGSANHISDRLSIIVKGHCMSCAVFY